MHKKILYLIFLHHSILHTQTYQQSFKKDMETSQCHIGYNMKNRIS